ncbi:MAG TPA: restriction endonuclease subunit S, partial [Nitrosomonas sp.]|nr:restriction endonuclease subunit S [Nitrosomonas sp.]
TIAANIADTAILGIPACFPDSVIGFTPYEGKSDAHYIKYYFDIFQKTFQQISQGVTQDNLSAEKLLSMKIPVPPLPTQQKIAAILSAYDDLIENNLKRIKLLEEMAQITYEEWFVRMRFPGYESVPIETTGLPEGWEVKAISTICDVNKTSISTRNTPEKIRYIDISSAETGSYSAPLEMAFSEAPSRARRRLAFGDTIFSTVRPNRRVYSLILEDDPLLVASTGFAVLTPHQHHNFPFIYLTIDQQSFTDAAVAVAGGAAYPAVNQTDFERIKIMIPTAALMKKFSDMCAPYFILKSQLLRENMLLKEARDILLPRLMTGVIDVENYNPADLLKEVA